jgi:uncharacterized membrane protein YhhN
VLSADTTRSKSVDAWILWVAAAVALAYLVLQRPYAGDVALKTSMCVLLAIAAFRGDLKLFALALLFSAAGDAFLAYDGERFFVPGLASFLATHVLYAVVFVLATKGAAAPMSAGRKAMLAVIPAFAAAYSVVLWPKLGALAIPVMLYIMAIQIAQDAGFYDQAHFNRAMQRFFREGPREFLQSDHPAFRSFLAASRRFGPSSAAED